MAPRSLSEAFDASVLSHCDKVAVRFKGRELTYRDLGARVKKLAGGLAALGVRSGDRVVMISANQPACMECLLACLRVGAVYEPCNVRLAPSVTKRVIERSGASVAVVSGELYPAMRELFEEVAHPVRVVVTGASPDEAHDGAIDYERLVEGSSPCDSSVRVASSDVVLLLHTSGTTGLPRGVLHTHEALARRVAADQRTMAFEEGCVTLCVLPLFHVTFVSALITLLVGGELVMASSRKATDLLAAIKDFGVTHLCVVPFLLRLIVAQVQRERACIDTLRFVIYGGEPVDEGLLACCQELFSCKFMQGYGMTETLGAVTMLLPEHHRHAENLLTAGMPLPGVEVRIIDDGGEELPQGVAGEVTVKTDTLMKGYACDEERTRQVVRDGWYLTGDIGMLDDRGFLVLIDRKSNMVITGGENVYPLEVERCIRMLDDVADVAVAGVPDAYWGESIVACVVRVDGSSLTERDVVAHCAHCLGGYKKPRKVIFAQRIERGASGKVSKAFLDELIGR
ncbi:class I adenylate-forming enzyme family protein [Gordonibacter sp. An230]|uniref:class I adenylate-forming enzyme family protein n=1 Tax=Gordonibacter sp. An230 TaxID=1965592 RepID=UPI00111D0DEB|nr:AMP-binding protein [Gordonibacter sp. An230]